MSVCVCVCMDARARVFVIAQQPKFLLANIYYQRLMMKGPEC